MVTKSKHKISGWTIFDLIIWNYPALNRGAAPPQNQKITLKVIQNLVLLTVARADTLWIVRTGMILFLILFNFLNYVMAYDSCSLFEGQISQCVDWQSVAHLSSPTDNKTETAGNQVADIHVCPCMMILNEHIIATQQKSEKTIFQSDFKIQRLSNFSNPLYRPPISLT